MTKNMDIESIERAGLVAAADAAARQIPPLWPLASQVATIADLAAAASGTDWPA